jgi:hypothetical protein
LEIGQVSTEKLDLFTKELSEEERSALLFVAGQFSDISEEEDSSNQGDEMNQTFF